jgi:hypothetical protein
MEKKLKELFKYEDVSIFSRYLLSIIMIGWSFAIFAGGNLGIIHADGTYGVIGDKFTGNQIWAWCFLILGIDSLLPNKLSPFAIVAFLITAVVKGIKHLIKHNWE